ncbi:MAG: hypothetical protein KDA92_23445, partial [Planctomycetales bacterium]|nr:hypothetical protein [Planctomycetales bacterium]
MTVTLVGLLFAWLGREWRQTSLESQLAKQCAVASYVGPFDSSVLRQKREPQGWWRDLARYALGERLLSINVENEEVKMAMIGQLSKLEQLMITSKTEIDLKPLANLTSLESLYLKDVLVTNLRPLATLTNLKRLSIVGSPVVDLTPLARLTNLEQLALISTPISDLR